jgi:phosphoribosylcarboxyaminoimidazole (NCAIR) mutase
VRILAAADPRLADRMAEYQAQLADESRAKNAKAPFGG